MSDPTEADRRVMQAVINSAEAERKLLEEEYGQVWNTEELSKDFSVEGFLAPFVVVFKKSDNKKGTLMFQHSPRYYFGFQEN
jgi:hypothetical protein